MEIHTVAARAAPGDLGLKSHPKDYQQKSKVRNLEKQILR